MEEFAPAVSVEGSGLSANQAASTDQNSIINISCLKDEEWLMYFSDKLRHSRKQKTDWSGTKP